MNITIPPLHRQGGGHHLPLRVFSRTPTTRNTGRASRSTKDDALPACCHLLPMAWECPRAEEPGEAARHPREHR
ncbi:MAG: hypothetical protein MZU79_08990 [Anaerotruncus sp.]|nr:hypothetical protein [Anaerotruncus sp.]